MNARKIFYPIILIFLMMITNCSWDNSDDSIKSMEDLDVDLYFTFNTSRQVYVEISGTPDT